MSRSTRYADCLLVVPMKDPSASKTRLSADLSETQRRNLARLLFRRTLEVLQRAQQLAQSAPFDLAVVTGSDEPAAIAAELGVGVIDEGRERSLSSAARKAADWAENKGYASLCIIPADLAAPDAADVVRLVASGTQQNRAVICPAMDQGTNALFVSPPTAMAFSYGLKSAISHYRSAEQAGLRPLLMPLDSLQFDIDTSASLEQAFREVPDLPEALNAS